MIKIVRDNSLKIYFVCTCGKMFTLRLDGNGDPFPMDVSDEEHREDIVKAAEDDPDLLDVVKRSIQHYYYPYVPCR